MRKPLCFCACLHVCWTNTCRGCYENKLHLTIFLLLPLEYEIRLGPEQRDQLSFNSSRRQHQKPGSGELAWDSASKISVSRIYLSVFAVNVQNPFSIPFIFLFLTLQGGNLIEMVIATYLKTKKKPLKFFEVLMIQVWAAMWQPHSNAVGTISLSPISDQLWGNLGYVQKEIWVRRHLKQLYSWKKAG